MIYMKWIVILALVVLMGACDVAPSQMTQKPNKDVRSTSAKTDVAVACPSHDFNKFIAVFMGDEKVQIAFTKYPYAVTSYDSQNLEDGQNTSYLSPSEVSFPVMLSRSEAEQKGVSMEVERKEKNWYAVSTHSAGSGVYSMIFNFKWLPECWFLTDSVDAST